LRHPALLCRLNSTLSITKSLVLRGAGRGLSTIYMPSSLTDLQGNTWGRYTNAKMLVSDYSHGGAVIRVQGADPTDVVLARITQASLAWRARNQMGRGGGGGGP